jgi:hypothetical protein
MIGFENRKITVEFTKHKPDYIKKKEESRRAASKPTGKPM